MAKIGKSSWGKMPDGREISLYTLRNTKGATVKVTDLGAKLVGWRTMGRGYEYINLMPESEPTGDVLWTASEEYEGVRFTLNDNGQEISVLYSFSNDNELLIRYHSTGSDAMSCPVTGATFALGAETKWELCVDGKDGDLNIIRDVPPDIEMEPGMFGYDPTCPVDYLEAGLKKAAQAANDSTGVNFTAFTNLPGFVLTDNDNGAVSFLATSKEAKQAWEAQVVYVVKVR